MNRSMPMKRKRHSCHSPVCLWFRRPSARNAARWTLAAYMTLALTGCLSGQTRSTPPLAAAPTAEAQASTITHVGGLPSSGLVFNGLFSGAGSTPAAVAALQHAHTHLLDGNYVKALQEFSAIPMTFPDTAEAADAVFFFAAAALEDRQLDLAAETLRRFLAMYPDHPRRAVALLMLGRTLEEQGDGGAAAAAYKAYMAAAEPEVLLADFLHLQTANIYFGASRPADGWTELGLAASAADQIGSTSARARVYNALGARYAEASNRAEAAAAWNVALEQMVQARRPTRNLAETAARMAAAYQGAGRRDQANAMRWRIIGEWPDTVSAAQAMNEVGADAVPAFQRGRIAFSNRRWAQTVESLTGYLEVGAPNGRADEARYYRAVALARLGNDDALAALDRVVERQPESSWAGEALWEAGTMLLRQGDRSAAAARFERLGVGYPLSERRGQALYWSGKLLPDLGSPAAAQRYLAAAASGGPEDFYTFRARAMLRRPAPAPQPLVGQEQITIQERAAWEQWLVSRGVSPQAQVEQRAHLEQDFRFRRATTLLDAGFRRDADEEFRDLLEALDNDPVVVAHVALHVRDRGSYPLSVTLGHRLLTSIQAAGEPSLLAAPRLVQKLVLPLAFFSLVEPEAKAKSVDPLLLLGLMKQESWFEPRALSTANARGLTQFIPATARTVAEELKWPNWTWDEMNKPYVSVPFGAHHLSTLIRDFRGNPYFALAGYNAGPGNVLRWAKGDWNRDLDLFVEDIGFAETRNYVKSVAANHELYKAIYYG